MVRDLPPPQTQPRTPSDAYTDTPAEIGGSFPSRTIGARAVLLGALLCAGVATLNGYLETAANVHFVGGTQLPLGPIFLLLLLTLGFNGPVKKFNHRLVRPFNAAELVTIYAMSAMAALVSTPGNENSFLTTGASLFYFSTRENGWANVFYQHIPSWWAPGWDGKKFDSDVINGFYTGGVSAAQIPWHAWTVMLSCWGVFCGLLYGLLFFTSLLFRRQWVESEALTFPLVQLQMEMVDAAGSQSPANPDFWTNRLMWAGFGIATFWHLLRGLNHFFPDWPIIPSFQGNPLLLGITEAPWNAAGNIRIEFFFGAVGVAYLLTREVAFSFWFFYAALLAQLVLAALLGFPAGTMPADSYTGRPTFISFGATGGWLMMGGILVYSARGELGKWFRAALRPDPVWEAREPFGARFTVGGFLVCGLGLLAWCGFAGLNPVPAIAFWGLYLLIALVLSRLVIESGMIYPQVAFSPVDLLTKGVFGSDALGPATLTQFAVLQPTTFADMRSCILPAWLHTLKMGHDLKLERPAMRRLLIATALGVCIAFVGSIATIIATIYKQGGLSAYTWFTYVGARQTLNAAASNIAQEQSVQMVNWLYMIAGALFVLLLMAGRARFSWFPFHPLGFIAASSPNTGRLVFSFFVGWLMKSLIIKFGGADTAQKFRPFAIGLILGNATAMVLWLLFGFYWGSQVNFWPA